MWFMSRPRWGVEWCVNQWNCSHRSLATVIWRKWRSYPCIIRLVSIFCSLSEYQVGPDPTHIPASLHCSFGNELIQIHSSDEEDLFLVPGEPDVCHGRSNYIEPLTNEPLNWSDGSNSLWSLADWVNTAGRPCCICVTLTGQGQSQDDNFLERSHWGNFDPSGQFSSHVLSQLIRAAPLILYLG